MAQIPAELVALADCTAGHLDDYTRILTVLQDVFFGAVSPGSPPAGITYTPVAGNTFTFTAVLDLDGSGGTESTMQGQITYSADPTDGIAVGDTAAANFTLTGALNTGGAALQITSQSGGLVRMAGNMQLTDPTGCKLVANPFDLVANPLAVPIRPTGSMSFNTTNATDGFAGSLDFDGTNIVVGSGVFSGGGTFDFTYDLATGILDFA